MYSWELEEMKCGCVVRRIGGLIRVRRVVLEAGKRRNSACAVQKTKGNFLFFLI